MADNDTSGLLSDASTSGPDWGGLLGGPRDDLIAPIIGQKGIDGARQNALLNLGVGLLANSGRSRVPITTGQALAAGIQQAQGAYQGSLDSSLKAAQQMQALKAARFDFARKQLLMQAAQGALQGAGGPAGPQAGAGMAPGPAGAGASAPGAAAGLPPPAAAATAAAGARGMFSGGNGRGAADAFTLLDPEHQAAYQSVYERDNPAMQIGPDGRPYDPRDPSIAGQNFAALPQGMIRDPQTGQVGLAPGFTGAQSTLDMNKALAEHSQDLITTTIPGKGSFQVPRYGITMGPDGKPSLTMQGGVQTGEDPASLEERKGDVTSYLAAKTDAQTKAQAATEQLPQLDNLDKLIHQAKPGYGTSAQYEVGRVAASMGLLSPEKAKDIDAIKQFQMQQLQATMSGLKATFGNRVTNTDINLATKALGDQNDPMQAVLLSNDMKRVQAQRIQARAQFLENYDGPRGKFEQSWEKSPEAQKGLYDYPEMWKHLPVVKGKDGTPVAGQTFVKTPSGSIYPVQLNEYGEPAPVTEGQ